ncbi:MAG TPA: DNA polymerase III subunit beta [Clostridia bacterium]|nr:DNA polymerase III subunit beta [Clostridia bacterium]
MKFTCPKDKLLKAIQIVQRAVATRTTAPYLSCILLEAGPDQVVFRATDREIMIQYEIPVEVVQEGKALLPARYLGDLVRRLPNMDITLEQQLPDQVFLFRYGNSQTQLIGMDPEDYPAMPSLAYNQSFEIQAGIFQKMVHQVSSASAVDSIRPIFSGIYLESTGNQQLNLVATDTHRLAYTSTKLPVPLNGDQPISIVIPTKTLLEVTRLAEDEESMIKVFIGGNQVIFLIDTVTVVTRVIEGQFPNYRQVIPETYTTRIKANTQLLYEGVDRATLLAQDSNKFASNVLKLTTKGETLILESFSQEIGRAYEEIPVFLQGEELEIRFNGRYLLDALKAVDAEEVYLDLTGNLNPGVFRPADGRDYLYLVLPVRSGV